MAALTDEQEIVIGVSVSIAVIVLIAVIVIICCIYYRKEKNKGKRPRYVKDKKVIRDFYYDAPPPRPFPVENNIYAKGHTVFVPPPYRPDPVPQPRFRESPSPYYVNPQPDPAPQPRFREPPSPYYSNHQPDPAPLPRFRESPSPYYNKPHRIEPYVVKAEGWETRSEPPVDAVEKLYYGDVRRSGNDGIYHNEPIVIPMSEPEYMYARAARHTPQTHYIRYHDDQALLRQSRSNYVTHPLRRSHSAYRQTDVRRGKDQPYVGEWEIKPDGLDTFNQEAMERGRDPFLWKQ